MSAINIKVLINLNLYINQAIPFSIEICIKYQFDFYVGKKRVKPVWYIMQATLENGK